jgi:hypothetical protein
MKKILDFEGYSITEDGIVFSHLRNKFKNHFYLKNGYLMVSLTKNKRQKNYSIHYLMAITYIGEKPSPSHQVMHLDNNKENNTIANLKWGTPRENHMDKKNHGTFQEGEKHGMHKLTAEKVLQIRASNLPLVHFAKLFNVTPEAISYAKYKGWRSLESSNRAEGRATS